MRLAAAILMLSALTTAADNPFAWPAATRETRPWSYWWWMASAVDPANLTREMERYRAAGWGGVHIIPIYGARGSEARYIDYLSPRWMEMLRHTVTEGQRLDLGVDMTTGTGWCFGGPNITAELATALVVPKSLNGDAVSLRPGNRVKRAAPGGEGYMLNPFYRPAIETYLKRFDAAFASYTGPKPRSMYHDSFEYQVNWSPDLPAEFERRRGYRLQTEFPALFGGRADERAARVKSDYRETVAELMLDNFTRPWVDWSHKQGFLTRNQAHGSPGNLLDLYAAADIPETEMFNRDRSTLVSKFASSAAHTAGRKLVACETGTWLKEHFNETLGDMKELADQLFLAGVNHVLYHGTCYSPDDAAWPGWLFYASTEMNPRNAFWRDVPALNAYITRAQSLLQAGRSDNDVALYWPVYDLWHNPQGMTLNLTVHTRSWLEEQPIGALAHKLWERGFAFDFVSDRQLSGNFQTVLSPECKHMPPATLARLLELARSGSTIVFEKSLPADVPGLANLEARRDEFKKLLASINLSGTSPKEARLGRGRVLVGDVEAALARAGVRRESLVDQEGLQYIRRASPSGRHYFIANRGTRPVDGWVPLATQTSAAVLLDPMTGRTGLARTRKGIALEVYLQLDPGQSVFVRTVSARGPAWTYWKVNSATQPVSGTWQVRFLQGGPELPPPYQTARLASWTEQGAEPAQRFAGTALYSLRFDAQPGDWFLELGRVCESARVRLNGKALGTLFAAPWRVYAEGLKAKDNLLEIEVTNLSANRVRDLDRRKVPWKIFHDINIVGQDYKPLDASNWPLRDSGLLGPVVLRGAVKLNPAE
ncbi:MAG: glycoside hydrolase [Acidobacteria bacterium]|nr:glycoside hydrolase [Acidobacteriota bacterium]